MKKNSGIYSQHNSFINRLFSFQVLNEEKNLELGNPDTKIIIIDPLIEIQNDFYAMGAYVSDLITSFSFMGKKINMNKLEEKVL